jgi:O-Antigen ligase
MANPLVRMIVLGLLLVVTTFLVSQGITVTGFEYAIGAATVLAVFIFVFIKTEAGLYLVLFSMLLSPEFALGGGLAERRSLVVRLEDLLLIAISLSWFAKTAVNKEIGLVVKTPLNPWILFYVVTALFSTTLGYLQGTVKNATGFFYVLKYVEYFVVYYTTVNNVRDRAQAWRLVMAAMATAAMVSVIGAAQIPSGQRVSAPFEGEAGEPNTFGGYLLLMMAIAAGIALETTRVKTRGWTTALIGVMAVPFVFTLSRASYLAVLPVIGTLALLSSRRILMMGALAVLVLVSPIVMTSAVPEPVKKRILYTFQPERGQPTVRVGQVAFDPSTSERLIAMQHAVTAWTERPLFGYGVTGFRFMDAQYARTLVETGIFGMAAFLALLWAVLRVGLASARRLDTREDRGLAIGFVAGTVGLLIHAVGSNSFIIIRIMEPFWFFAGVVMLLPTLPSGTAAVAAPRPAPLLRYSV